MTDVMLIEAGIRDVGRELAAVPADTRSLNLHANAVAAVPRAFFARLLHLAVLDLSSNQVGSERARCGTGGAPG